MVSSDLQDFVKRKNGPDLPEYRIPAAVADLMEKELNCNTAKIAQHGLRWEYEGIGVVFLEKIKHQDVTVYILPTTIAHWRTPGALKKIFSDNNLSHLNKKIITTGNGKNLRVEGVSWRDSIKALPILVKWSYSSQTGKSLKLDTKATQPEWPPKDAEDYSRACDREAGKLQKLSIAQLQDKLNANNSENAPKVHQATTTVYCRDINVIAFCKKRSDYCCEIPNCNYKPFTTLSIEPYIEVHHIQMLSEGGTDTIENVACVCPAHHRELHFGKLSEKLRQQLVEVRKRIL